MDCFKERLSFINLQTCNTINTYIWKAENALELSFDHMSFDFEETCLDYFLVVHNRLMNSFE